MERYLQKEYTCEELVDMGKQFIFNKKYQLGIAYLNEAYKREDSRAAYEMYMCYAKGIGVEVDTLKSFYYEEESARLGYVIAQENLAKRLLKKDKIKQFVARNWLKKAALQNSVYSLLLYSIINFQKKNINEANIYFNKLIELGYDVNYFINKTNKAECFKLLKEYKIDEFINIEELLEDNNV